MLDHQEVVHLALILQGQVQVYSYFRTVNVVDFTIIAHCGHKRDPVPLADYSVPNVIGVLVTYAIEIIRLIAHVRSSEFYAMHS